MSAARDSSSNQCPADLRAVFGRNLKQLVAGEPSVTRLCLRLQINRTQFNRYLSGETFPRPDILHRICQYFHVDARILLEPLAVQRPGSGAALGEALGRLVLAGNDFEVDHARLPDGLYRFWRSSFNFPDKVISDICRIHTAGGVTLFKGYELPNPMLSRANTPTPAERVYHGVFLQHDDGVSLYCATSAARMMSIGVFEYSLGGMSDYLGGLSFLTRRRMVGMRRVSAAVLERLPSNFSLCMAAARECGLHDASEAPVKIRELLAMVPASL